MHRFRSSLCVLALFATGRTILVAQPGAPKPVARSATSERAVPIGYTDVGPTVGIGSLGGAGLAVGGRFERVFKPLPSLGNGALGIQLSGDTWSYTNRFGVADFSFRYIAIGATANYHLHLPGQPKLDPFVGLGLGNSSVSTDFVGSVSSGIYVIGRLGARYRFSPGMAAYADVGAGAATLNVGVTFRLAGGK